MAEIKEARVPDIGDFDAVPVIEVLVAAGDHVDKDQSLITLESDKATMEVPAPFAGTVKEMKVKVGDEVAQGAVIATVEADADDAPAKAGKPDATTLPSPPARGAGGEEKAPASTSGDALPSPAPAGHPLAAGEGTSAHDAGKTAAAESAGDEKSARAASQPEAGKGGDLPHAPPVAPETGLVLPGDLPYASPAVRAFARELGVDVAQVTGSGRKGRIQREDVQAYVKHALASGARPASGAATGGLELLPWPKVDFAKFGEIEEQPLSRIQKIAGANLARNWAMIPHVTQHDDADITDMEAFRKQLGKENPDAKITPLVFLIKASVAALKAYPQFNASLDPSGEKLILKKYFHIGIAVDTPDGLVVPVLRDCDQKGLLELARELGEISVKARDKKLGPAEMSGGCFSISSLGGIGGSAFTPIVNAPEVAILGVSRSRMTPVWNGAEFSPRLMLPLSLSYDHRVVDGAAAARFAAFLAKALGDLRRLLL